jgi:hypothetical protein
MYDPQKVDNPHDIALLRLREPFPIDRFIQTVALPTTPHQANLVGSLASFDHNMLLPEGQVAVFRAPIPTDSAPEGFVIDTANAQGSICGGDSGSGLVTYEDGRATVRGIVFAVLVGPSGDCKTVPSINQHFSDVFAHRDWILETMRTVDYRLSGTNRVRWTGWRGVTGTRGVMGIGCENDYGTMWGPLDVRGVELGANCVPGSGQGVVCSVNAAQTNPYPLAITGFTMKTTCAPHGTSVESLPFSANAATYNGLAPVSPDPPGVCTREFTCQLGRSWDFVISDVFKFTQ